MRTIEFEGKVYPHFQAEGNAAKFAIPYAQQVCKGRGLDIGCNRPAWAFPGAIPVDPVLDPRYSATTFDPDWQDLDYIFSSHCLEHVPDWVDVLDFWTGRLREGGILFLYLPDFSQRYWRPWNNRKHLHVFTSEIISAYLSQRYHPVFTSGVDLNSSFMAIGEKA